MKWRDKIDVQGRCRATQVAHDENGREVPIEEALSDEARAYLEERGYDPPRKEFDEGNLVVNTGRSKMARLTGGDVSNVYINRLVIGDISDSPDKSKRYPQLDDAGLVRELRDDNGNLGGTFMLQSSDKTYPSQADRHPTGSGSTWASTEGEVNISSGESVFEDTNVDFTTSGIGVQTTDQIVLNTNTTNPLVVGVKEIKSATELVIHNPREFETAAGDTIKYRIETPGTQLLVSKYISGDEFPSSDWGAATIAHEAGLIFNDDTFFNRVMFAPNMDTQGMIFQPQNINGMELGARFEWLVTV